MRCQLCGGRGGWLVRTGSSNRARREGRLQSQNQCSHPRLRRSPLDRCLQALRWGRNCHRQRCRRRCGRPCPSATGFQWMRRWCLSSPGVFGERSASLTCWRAPLRVGSPVRCQRPLARRSMFRRTRPLRAAGRHAPSCCCWGCRRAARPAHRPCARPSAASCGSCRTPSWRRTSLASSVLPAPCGASSCKSPPRCWGASACSATAPRSAGRWSWAWRGAPRPCARA
mmetsp:Transcript_64981/g.190098  ORF Transcript_64981/g.190098 Transcript_64981/m.190098 type:complete len:227 (+) Transcript_64981:53-733(+)